MGYGSRGMPSFPTDLNEVLSIRAQEYAIGDTAKPKSEPQ